MELGAELVEEQVETGVPVVRTQPPSPVDSGARMTFDDVVTKTAVTMGLLIVTAALAWAFMPEALYFPAMILSALVGFVVVLLVSFRRVVSPPLVLVYAAIEGVFIGMISKIFNDQFAGIVVQAVFATFVAAGVTLAAYKFFNIRVTPKFQKVVFIATAAFAVAMLLNFVLSLVGVNLGFRAGVTGPVSLLAIGVSALGVVLAALFFATLSQGGLAVNALVPKQMVDVLQAVVILAVATSVPEVRRLLRGARAGGSAR